VYVLGLDLEPIVDASDNATLEVKEKVAKQKKKHQDDEFAYGGHSWHIL